MTSSYHVESSFINKKDKQINTCTAKLQEIHLKLNVKLLEFWFHTEAIITL